jgi:O-antigen/teichoic acid export membrane protein
VITVIVGLSAAWFIVREGGMVRAVWAQNALQFVLFAGLFALHPSLGRPPSLAALRRVGRYAGLIGLAGLGFFLYTRVDVLILGQFGYIEEIGYYDLVMKVFNLFLLPFGVVAQAAGPRMAILASKEGPRALRPRARRAMAVVAPLGILAALVYGAGLYPAARLLLPHLAAPALLTASLMLAVLLPLRCWSIYLTQGLIVPGGMARIVTATTLAGAAANIAADYLLVGPFGFTGVVAATLLVHSAVTVANHALFMRACRTAREAA